MLYYWYQPLITINKPEIQRFCLSCLELNAVYLVITGQLLHKAEYDIKSYADGGGYPPKPPLTSMVKSAVVHNDNVAILENC